MKLRSKILLFSLPALLFCACSKDDADDYSYPSVLTELVEANVNADQLLTSIRTDAGNVLNLNNQQIRADRPDTTYRCVCIYEPTSTSTAKVYSIESVISALPKPASAYEQLPQDPIRVISTWQSDRYFNMQLSYLTIGAERHTFGFCEEQTVVDSNGKTVVSVRLLHLRPEADTEAFTQKRYLSLPTYPYAATCDSIFFVVPTSDGDAEYHFSLR